MWLKKCPSRDICILIFERGTRQLLQPNAMSYRGRKVTCSKSDLSALCRSPPSQVKRQICSRTTATNPSVETSSYFKFRSNYLCPWLFAPAIKFSRAAAACRHGSEYRLPFPFRNPAYSLSPESFMRSGLFAARWYWIEANYYTRSTIDREDISTKDGAAFKWIVPFEVRRVPSITLPGLFTRQRLSQGIRHE